MNLQSLSGRYMVATESAEAPDYAMGKPRRVTDEKPAEPERWVATETSGYQRSTTTGAVRKTPEYASAPAVPPWGPCGVAGVEDDGACCVPSVDDFRDAVRLAMARGVSIDSMRALLMGFGTTRFTLLPEHERAPLIEALNKLEA